ncbi:MAG: adenylyl-sulfate kinase, partial [Clostridiales bacterium]|nr:adenylyl-sulfate kinase [Clostridiales bacterium]
LLTYLEQVPVADDSIKNGFVLPVQRVCRPDRTFRGFQGQVACGQLRVGDEVTVLPSGEKAHVSHLLMAGQPAEEISAGEAVTVQLDREVDVSRGDVIMKNANLNLGRLFTATILWMDDTSLSAGRNYTLKLGTKQIPATVLKIRHKIDINTGSRIPADRLKKNELAVCDIAASDRVIFNRFQSRHGGRCDKALGCFLLIDRVTNMTSACGTVLGPLVRDKNLVHQETDITKELRASQKNQKPLTVWFTGLSGSGKSALANELEKRLVAMGKHTMLLDGDNIRMGLNKNLGFEEADRVENIRRIAEVAKLMNDAGLIVMTSFISPFERDRNNAREVIGSDFFEVYVSTPLEECERRDVKGLYQKARNGEIPDFTGISSPFEVPQNPDLTVNTADRSVESCVDEILHCIEGRI